MITSSIDYWTYQTRSSSYHQYLSLTHLITANNSSHHICTTHHHYLIPILSEHILGYLIWKPNIWKHLLWDLDIWKHLLWDLDIWKHLRWKLDTSPQILDTGNYHQMTSVGSKKNVDFWPGSNKMLQNRVSCFRKNRKTGKQGELLFLLNFRKNHIFTIF